MSNYDENLATSGAGDAAIAIDANLRSYMLRIYNHMAAGVALTAVVAWLTYQLTGPALLQNPIMWVFILAPLVLVFFISARINTLSVSTARWLFFVYAALVGVSLSTIFHIYTNSSITRVFFITAAMFGALSLFGYTTRRNLSGMGTFLFMWIGLMPRSGAAAPGAVRCKRPNTDDRQNQYDFLEHRIHRAKCHQHIGDGVGQARRTGLRNSRGGKR